MTGAVDTLPALTLAQIEESLRKSPGVQQKAHIRSAYSAVGEFVHLPPAFGNAWVRLGDDCAAIRSGEGWLLFAADGMIESFVNELPWFAGYSAVMVNVSDVCAMGGRPMAVVDALWSGNEATAAREVWKGMLAASHAYGVPIVGGHTAAGSGQTNLSVSVLGKARRLMTTFEARPGDQLLAAIDLRGEFYGNRPFWNASTTARPDQLQRDVELLPFIAEAGLCKAARDISMGGIVGTALMLLEASGAGASIDLGAIPCPAEVPLDRWLTCFPSYGYLLSVQPWATETILQCFRNREIACAAIGSVHEAASLELRLGGGAVRVLDLVMEESPAVVMMTKTRIMARTKPFGSRRAMRGDYA